MGLESGCVQVYTGNGKGKSTAALGLALRAAGAGLKVFIAQFAKGQRCSEHDALERYSDLVTLRHYGSEEFIRRGPEEGDLREAHKGLKDAKRAISSGEFDVVILDEGNVAVHLGLISEADLLDLISSRPSSLELVITGRNAHEKVIAAADLVTEMTERKHYYCRGVPARKGIEF